MLKKLILLLSTACSFGIVLASCSPSKQSETSTVSTATTLPNPKSSESSKAPTATTANSSKNATQSNENQPSAGSKDASANSPASISRPPLTTEKLKNAEYFFLAKGPIKLSNGKYKDETTQRTYTLGDVVAYGDINQDGIKDAVTDLKVTIPNTGSFSYLVALVNSAGMPKNVSTEFMGPEIKVKTLKVNSDNSIAAVLEQYQPGDPECCPSLEIQRTYKLRNQQAQSSSKAQPPK